MRNRLIGIVGVGGGHRGARDTRRGQALAAHGRWQTRLVRHLAGREYRQLEHPGATPRRRTCRPALASSRATRSRTSRRPQPSRRKTSPTAPPRIRSRSVISRACRASRYMPYPFQIFQTPAHIAITYEYVHAVRRIFMKEPHPDDVEWFMGDSRGHWEGDTLVVDVSELQRPDLVRPQRQLSQRGAARDRALHAGQRQYTSITKRPSKIRRCSPGPGR